MTSTAAPLILLCYIVTEALSYRWHRAEPTPVLDVPLPVSDAGGAYADVNLVPMGLLAYDRAVERRCDLR
jgi:hypothetical protein